MDTSGILIEFFFLQLSMSQLSRVKVVPDYNQIFKAPPRKWRDVGKLYGRKFAAKFYASEWVKYNNNMKKANRWLYEALETSSKNDGETKREWLRRICGRKMEEEKVATEEGRHDPRLHMEVLNFGSTTLSWQLNEIVEHLVERLDQMRKQRNRKLNREEGEQMEILEVESTNKNLEITENDKGDEEIVMEEMGEIDCHSMKQKLTGEIKYLKRFVENPKQFAGYTLMSDEEKIHLLATYFRGRKKQRAACSSASS